MGVEHPEAALTAPQFNALIHQPIRLRVMAALQSGPMDFTLLRTATGATDGNLGAHLAILEKAGLVTTEKSFIARKPRTRVAQTQAGQAAYANHVAYLRAILEVRGGAAVPDTAG